MPVGDASRYACPCLVARPRSQQRLRLLHRTISTQSDEQLQEHVRDFIDRKQPTAKRSLHPRVILSVQIWAWMSKSWVRLDWSEGRWLLGWNVCGRAYSFDSGSGDLADRSRLPISANGHRRGENGRPAHEKRAICRQSARSPPPARLTGKSLRLAHKKSSRGPRMPSRSPPQRAELSLQIY